MAKRDKKARGQRKRIHPHKTKKRLERKRAMLAQRAAKRHK